MKSTKRTILLILAFAAASAIVSPFLSSYNIGLLSQLLIFAILAMSLDVLLGYAGLPSLGQSAFFGTGAYVSGLFMLHVTHSFWLSSVAAVGAALMIGALFGLLTIRTHGSAFLMITLALSQILWGIAFTWRSLTGGEDGLPGVARPDGIPWDLTSAQGFFYLVLVVFLLSGVTMVLFVRSPVGLALEGIRESESRMQALGYDVWALKYLGYVFAAGIASVAGILYVHYNSFVNPSYLGVGFSAQALLMVILGGAGRLVGAIFGSMVLVLLQAVVTDLTQRWMLVTGIIYILVVLFFPRGILGTTRRRRSRETENATVQDIAP
jgi:branched-chain amino acid transport system permease protein